ncbi:UDP-N-acetylmuramate--L-alanine ligase [Candidatus Daviesbacteria bacterium]|nr:UDP-N-acetylmuramate--L-alanine ligase [Candidatus Daviesbacteria bacterium]
MGKNVHFLGIGGSGTSAAAAIAQAQGYKVTGCDLHPVNEFTKSFKQEQLLTGHHPEHLNNIDILAVTPAIFSLDPNNPELVEAKKKNIPILTWQQFTGKFLTKEKHVIAVCGTHGKSTTTAMIAQMIEDANLDPTVLLGAIVPKWSTNYRLGKDKYFVIEADEFNDNFLSLNPNITVVTNIDMDHPEYFKNFSVYQDSFFQFLLQTKDTIVANLSDKVVAEILKDVMKQSKVACFDYSRNDYNLKLKIPGQFNISNASAAFQVGLLLDIDPSVIRKSLENYSGIGRRFEYVGLYKGAKIYTDFGHHPTEIKTTMEAARVKFPKEKIWLFFEPHMFSRTKYLFDDFVKVLKLLPVDQIILLDIYPSRELDTGLVKSWQLVQSVQKHNVRYQNPEELKETLGKEIKKGDVVFFMGAGDIDKLARKLVMNA